MSEFSRKTRSVSTTSGAIALGVFSLLLSSCGPELSRISALDNLRIIGLKKSAPYARPGETVKLSLLWEDGSSKAPRNVDRFVGFWCVNPPGDLYSECLTASPNVVPKVALNEDEVEITIPTDALRKSTSDPNLPPYGVAFVFYAVCAGQLVLADGSEAGGGAGGLGTGASATNLPICRNDAGEVAEGDDYIIGYSSIYIYDEFRNTNPILNGFQVDGKDVAVDCVGDDCVGKPFAEPELTGCVSGVACIASCDSEPCPEVSLKPLIDKKSVEFDEVSKAAYGDEFDEGLWASYFVDRGSMVSDVRLVNDPTTGFNEDYGAKFLAPKEKGPLRIWAAVRDNRGGVNWIRVPAYVK